MISKTDKITIKFDNMNIASFINKAYQILENSEYVDIIAWNS